MPIRASSSKQVDALVKDLESPNGLTREAAIARLAVIGGRATARLIAAAENSSTSATGRAAALRALEATGDPRGLDSALGALADADQDVAVAAIALAAAFLDGPRGASVLDRLTALALNIGAAERVRVAAIGAVATLDARTVAPLLTALDAEPSRAVRQAARLARAPRELPDNGSQRRAPPPIRILAEGDLPPDPAAVRASIERGGSRAPLPALLRVIERIREREAAETGATRDEWTRARGAAHVALALRGSRLALYDLRESIEAAVRPLPVEFLKAVSLVGDVSCLDAIAAGRRRSTDEWWRAHLVDAFRAIVARSRLTRRNAAVKKLEKRWPRVFAELWP